MPVALQRIVHVNNNCSDLSASLAFYEGLGLPRTIHTAPEQPQDGAAFGLAHAQWDAWILGSPGGISLDLLRWIVPAPNAAAARDPDDIGLGHITIGGSREAFVTDPDGTPLRLDTGEPGRISKFTVNCSSPALSGAFYEEVLGLSRAEPGILTDPTGFTLELRQSSRGSPNRIANGVGYFRMALYVQDILKGYEVLAEAGVNCWSEPKDLDLGPGVPRCSAMLFDDPDGAVLELIGPEIARSG
jgi:catechol 2,3-dioxygenase-like lactoylglutathione lyase family enzyme